MEEAKLLSEDCLPSIFALVSLLENVDEMTKVASGADVAFSFDEALMTTTMTSKGSSSDLGSELESNGSGLENEPGKSDRKNESSRYKKSDFRVREENEKIRKRFLQKLDQPEYKKMLEHRKTLPAWNERNRIVDVLDNAQVVVISGMTGCGKR